MSKVFERTEERLPFFRKLAAWGSGLGSWVPCRSGLPPAVSLQLGVAVRVPAVQGRYSF